LVGEDGTATPIASIADIDPGDVDAVAHRVVHGGGRFREPVVIDAAVREQIFELEPLAPLHNAPALAAIGEAEQALPDVPHMAVFDTAFHATIPDEAALYASPLHWRDEWGIRRYGFHGLSVQWATEQVAVSHLVVCHLGGGCSVTAVRDGRSVDTTMGFSPLEGVPMTTRSGSIDPGALLYLLRERDLDADALDHALNVDSGLEALSGLTGGMREIEAAARAGDRQAGLAVGIFIHRVAGSVAAMAAAAGGIDALVFTAGIGERSALVRERVAERLGFLGVELDRSRNADAVPDCDVASEGSRVRVFVVRAREELVAGRAARALLAL
jgi:acetate kinase